MSDWTQYLGHHITPEQYAAQGGNEATIRRDLKELWGDPKQGDDYMTPGHIRRAAKRLARCLPD